ncbi:hypothetical protein [Fusobacterium ulcerans]|uniref:Uncharacterized protein n=2 Tax=Fusobacterium TaxID=848 RepID=A0AAX2JCB5_9FUSO|nr:hypothetical protein [Fusobacterium ulcerans]AVQ26854.1 hypothetical protein C4N20_01710 [Fusobacterium ulcerans]EFS25024.1 hypothetical protein FUAG_00539 [Fusobacterium ulcerans ATCC 49185]SQJ08320.1 Uncharacterised protein [Fusobacterium ulcerans]
MKADRHPELIGSTYEMTKINEKIFWNLIALLQNDFKEKNPKKSITKIDNSTYVIATIRTKHLKELLGNGMKNAEIKKALEEIYNTEFAFKKEDFSKKHKLFSKLGMTPSLRDIIIEIKVGYRYLFYPSNGYLAGLEKSFRKQIEAKENSKLDSTYRSTRTKAKNFIMKDISLEDLLEFKKLVAERMIELKEIKKNAKKTTKKDVQAE